VIPDKEIIIVHCGNSNELFSAYDLWHVADCIKFYDFHQLINQKGVSKSIRVYHEKKKQDPAYEPFNERFLMDKGYGYLHGGKTADAKKIFALNIESYPDSWNVYNNMAEAYTQGGCADSAKIYYRKSLKIKPNNNWAAEKLEGMK
jgi:tetratricopeptide (TPR) repeat protein